ncbi:DUF2800 domain-containing protein [uncultured Clostridium sp.]|uniref:DUF2800 domain-containing protein n=1 Tax=uncultured Clostridium sp. TaxID=59620 RepID=UPI0025E158FE|nr:DUF2800 domain-containing protein [uncultured Clostridium sp.]
MGAHALLSASASKRWLSCPPSARLCENSEDKTSEYAMQGIDAHSLCQYKLEAALGMKTTNPTDGLTYYDEEMENCAESYASYVMEQRAIAMQTCQDPVVLIEQKLDFSKYVPEGFGTGDCVIIADGTLTVIDYKHGKGILVEAEHNPQMECYALGALELFDGIYDIETVSMTIFQPRRENVSTYTISKEELLRWAADVLVPTAKLAYAGEGEFRAGEHCQFCKVKATCRKRAEYNLELARYDFEMPATLEDEEIEGILAKADNLASWVNDIKEYALQSAISGKEWSGWKVVEGRSNRKYTDESAVADAVTDAGFDPYEQKLLGITAMTSVLGKKKFEDILGGLIYKPQGKPTLVPESDKRPVMNTANQDFKEKEGGQNNV